MVTIRRFFVSAVLACFLHVKAELLSSDQGPWPSRRTVIETVFPNTERKLEDELSKRVLDSTTIGAQGSSSQRSAALTRYGRQLLIRVWRLPDPPPSSPQPMQPNEPPPAPLAPYLPSMPPLPRPPRPPPRPQLKPPPPPVRLQPPLAPLPSPPPPPTPTPPPAPVPPKRPSPTAPPPVRASPPPPRRPPPPPPAPSPPRPGTPAEVVIGPTSETGGNDAADFAMTGGNCSDIPSLVSTSNMYRAWHQSPPLAWSSAIATEAQAYAEVLAAQQCDLEHAGVGGECLYGTEMYPKPDWSCKRAIDAWYSEVKAYDFTVPNPYDYNVPRGTGHFAQLVWSNSSVFGCGVGKADVPMSRMPGGYGGCKVVVCRYKSGIKASNTAFLQNVFPRKGNS
ncbi:hypothetical protein VaNZ11_003836 [Volvox africanus]|uniref:DBB domain-containing protein n=1 Tax=Volvox africanus TaxID=51714 RepID=A0ABQ5RWT9_9CHLO|nr:hypothetical protein VaNZ11_003836 [Volvox africanus]